MQKLSIITINLNNAKGLKKTIDSVIYQTFKDFDYIIIDGSSTDGSLDVIKSYTDIPPGLYEPRITNHESRISYWISSHDTGIYNAMNKGIKQAKGEYLLFLNSGDWFINNDVLKECFQTNFQENIAYGYQLEERCGSIIVPPSLDVEYITFRTLKRSHIPHQCTFIRKELFEKYGYYSEEYQIISDWAFIMKCLFLNTCSIKRLPVNMTVYDTNGISSTTDFKQLQEKERRSFLEKNFPLFMPDYDYFEQFMNKNYMKFILKLRKIINTLMFKK